VEGRFLLLLFNNNNNIALCFLTLYAADYDIHSQSWDTERELQWE